MAEAARGAAEEAARSFEEGCQAHLERIHRYVRASVRSREDAEDLTQDVFAQAFAGRAQFTVGDLGAWMYRIAKNRVAMHYRREAVERRGRQAMEREAAARADRGGEGSGSEAARRELRGAALDAIGALDETSREAIRLKFSKAYDNVEIARILEVTPGNLGVILFRALKRLRRQLEAQGHA